MSLPIHPEELKSRIRQIQDRLGTPEESPGDIELVVHLCHQLGNAQQMQIISEYLSQSPSGAFFESLPS